MTKKQRKLLNRIIIAAILFIAGMIIPHILRKFYNNLC